MGINYKIRKQEITGVLVLFTLVLPFIMSFVGMHVLLSSHISIIFVAILLTLCWMFNFSETTSKTEFLFLIVNAIFLLLNVLFNASYGIVLNFYSYIISFLIFENLTFSVRQMKAIRISVSVCIAVLLFSFEITKAYDFLFITYRGNTVNTNTYGILWLALCYNLILLIDLYSESKWKILCFLVVIGWSGKFIWDSICRTAIMALAFFCVIFVVKKWNCKKILLMLVLIGLVFPSIYILMYEFLGDVEILGKSLFSGRQIVWLSTWEYIRNAPILGSGTANMINMGNGAFTDSAHNVYLGIWKTLGIVPLTTFIIYLFKTKDYTAIGKKAFLSCLLICIFETLLSDPNYNLIFVSLLMNRQKEKTKGILET